MARGVFWIVDDTLLAFLFEEDSVYGVAKSGKNYNHRLLWEHVRPKGCDKRFDYYPRGRVEYTGKGKPVIYMNPHVDTRFIAEIKERFELGEDPVVRYDYSRHYHCYLEEGYEGGTE